MTKRLHQSCSALPPYTTLLTMSSNKKTKPSLVRNGSTCYKLLLRSFPCTYQTESFILRVLSIIITTLAYSLHPYTFKRYIHSTKWLTSSTSPVHIPYTFYLLFLNHATDDTGEVLLHLLKTETTTCGIQWVKDLFLIFQWCLAVPLEGDRF